MSAPQSYSDLIYIGQLKKPHGTKGEVSALLLTDNKYIFDQIQQVFLIKNEKKKETTLQYHFSMTKHIVVKLSCFNSVNEIKEWVGSYIAIPPYDFKEEDGSYHLYQVYALKIIDENGAIRGIVTEINENNGNWIIVVGTDKKKVYVPFVKHFCKIDITKGTLLIPDDVWKQLYEL